MKSFKINYYLIFIDSSCPLYFLEKKSYILDTINRILKTSQYFTLLCLNDFQLK